ncbi:TonB-dependent siderophore receptor [Achromobacter xylosoxidans]|uniref:TonB-dependent siderophore receptor n=1 Tax=Alcaligenes xylosoxydans xylosoxydans TaxID=85698 RepID=UPI0022B883BF|nr:TonB-dependent siderophore receptor [Achromobacter xylosoxidans]MCZ8391869.1 TonB-dependent siderophore receptor [Achromobacter xylosoxidans]
MRSRFRNKARRARAAHHWPLWLAVAAGPALADDTKDAKDAATLPAVTVSGERDGGATQQPTLGKLPLSVRETPQSISVIGPEQMRQQNLQTLDDVMRHATGITVQPHSRLTTAYYSRGFKIDSFEQDGVPTMMGNVAATPEDVAVFERVEILRGANGLLHGAGNPAATINLVRKRPQRETTFGGELSAGSWDRYRAMADLGGPLNDSGSVRGRVVGVLEDRGFFYQAANQKTGLFYGVGEVDLGPGTVLSAGLQYQRVRSNPPPSMGGVPRYKDGSPLGLKRSTNLESIDSHSNWNTTRLFADLEHRFGPGWTAKLSFNHLKSDSEMKYLTGMGGVDPKTGTGTTLYGQGIRYDNSQTSFDAYVSGPIELFGRRHELLVGANSLRTTWENSNAVALGTVHGTPIDVFNWNPHDVPSYDVGPYKSDGRNPEREQGVYGMGRFSLADPVTLVLGGRFDWSRLASPTAEKRVNAKFTPYGGLIVDLNRQWSLYGSYAQVFKPQSEKDRDGKMLDPMTGTNYEVGVKGELAEALNVSLALFQIDQKDRAQVEPSPVPCRGRNCPSIPGGKVRSRGFEIEAAGNITPYWNLAAGYTFNTTRYLTDTRSAGLALASFTPRHIFRLWTEYALPGLARRLSVGGGVQVQSGFYNVAGPITLRQGGYALADMRVAYRVDKHVTVALNANNLFDRVYYQRLNDASWTNYYGEPRNFMLTVRAEY